ncbi:SAM-dependent methyltransferase [Leptolyngbya sp. NIES-3755]|nr:SAM-dependent methyltransferase [Leptolyngbya sp. NIES-3755]
MTELLRVAQEVRIFPLLNLDEEPSLYTQTVIETLSDQGFAVQVQSVAYEFQKGGNQMLKVNRKRSAASQFQCVRTMSSDR